MSNRLRYELSPYLKQHEENPVDWYPWGAEAFDRAVREDKPVFLSIGYSACHWCHVMAHESFEDTGVAEILNRSFVAVKVDREERPDVDDAYMTFVQMLTGRGGWPMSVFLLPDKSPFFGGTYFPLKDRGEFPGFRTTLLSIERLWKERRSDLDDAGDYYNGLMREDGGSTGDEEGESSLDLVLKEIRSRFDEENGGFGGAPKFPPHSALELLLSLNRQDEMAQITLNAMARGGIHDHVGGGFHRYSTDEDWHLPHFEKMLYDNALLLKSFASSPDHSATVTGIVSWLQREMRSSEGLFYSALDADSEGEEGKFYVWQYEDLLELPDGESFVAAYQCERMGNFKDEATGRRTGENVLHLRPDRSPFPEQLQTLLARRGARVRPGLDDKALVGWNGLAISGLAAAGRFDLATQCADAILRAENGSGRLPRYFSAGEAVGEGFLEDYAYFALALFDLKREEAYRIGNAMVSLFYDEEGGGFFSTGLGGEVLFGRSKPVFDQPIPSANSAAIRVLVRMGDLERAGLSIGAFSGWMARVSLACEGLFLAQLEFERVGGYSGASFQVAGFDGEVVKVVASLPKNWYLNPLEDGPLVRGTLAGKKIEVALVEEGTEVTLPQDLTLEYQLCSDRECLPVKSHLIRGAHRV